VLLLAPPSLDRELAVACACSWMQRRVWVCWLAATSLCGWSIHVGQCSVSLSCGPTTRFLFLCAVDFFVASSFDDMVFNMVRRLTDKNFGKDYSGNIFSNEFNGCSNVEFNVAMLGAWAGLSVFTMVFQFKVSSKLPPNARRGAGSPPVSDRFDHQCCPLECTVWCKKSRVPPHARSRRRTTRQAEAEGWGGSDDEAHPLVQVSGENGFRGSTSSWGSWTWMRNAARNSGSRRSSSVEPSSPSGDSPGRVFRSPRAGREERPLIVNVGESGATTVQRGRYASARPAIYEDDDELLDPEPINM
jgi:hypothetical protein